MNLPVFKFTYEAVQYGGGIALIAAANRSDAQLLLLNNDWEFDSVIEGLTFNGIPCIIAEYAYAE